MNNISFGVNTGFAINRHPLASDWLKIIENSGLRRIQLTADILDPRMPESFLEKEIEYILSVSRGGGPTVTSAFTGAFTRLNLFGHPNKDVRDYWFNWYKKFIDLSARLNVRSVGGHLSIISLEDDNSQTLRNERLENIIATWICLSEYAKNKGISALIWEPMSISREFGETLDAAEYIQNRFDEKTKGAIKICYDVDHGDISSVNKDDTDPYAWIEKFAYAIDCIHLKQSSSNKSGHWPFTEEYNKNGKIKKEKMMKCLRKNFSSDLDLFLELSLRERNPVDKKASEYIAKSAEYWTKI